MQVMHFKTTAAGASFQTCACETKNKIVDGHKSPDLRQQTKKLLLAMKLTTFILLTACMTASAGGHAQRITINEKNAPLEKVFAAIEKQTDYSFIYTDKLLKDAKAVTVKLENSTLEQALNLLFRDQPFTYTITDNFIVVKQKGDLSSAGGGVTQSVTEVDPPIDITGKVTDADGNPLTGATVKVKGTSKGTTTNNDGVFVLKGVDENATLEISFVGYESYTVAVNNKTEIIASLKVKPESLGEVVINKGYYTEKQRLSTGNVTKINSSDIEKQPVNNPLLALEGRVPGMVVTQTTGVAGGAVNVQIRGQNSIAQGNAPLYIVDGVPFGALPSLTMQGLSSNILGDQGRISPLNYLNAADIVSIEVLKDADATAIYGSRGSNGVILITTKQGQTGATKVNLNLQKGFGKVTRRADLLNTQQYLEMRNEAFANTGTFPSVTDYDVNGKWSKTSYTDWQDFFIGGTSHYDDYQVSISGGNSLTGYRIGGGYHRESTVFPMADDFNDQKTSIHFSANGSSSNKRFNIIFSGSYVADQNKLPASDFTQSILLAPNAPSLSNPDGTLDWLDFSDNPLRDKYRAYTLKSKNLIGNTVLKYQVLKNLELRANLGYTNTDFDENVAFPLAYFPPSFPYRLAFFNNYSTTSWIFEPQLSYFKHWNKSNVNILIGGTAQERNSEGQEIDGFDYANDALLGTLAAAGTISKGATIFEEYKYNSLFGRINYDWNQTYLFNLTARRDGSSRFGPGKQFGNFGAVGVGWIFSNEVFVQRALPILSFGKFRGSYGLVGNEPGSNYQYLELFNFTGNNPYQGGAGVFPENLPTPG
jgi:TonB-linked SusC/RagA family outer membrane protein